MAHSIVQTTKNNISENSSSETSAAVKVTQVVFPNFARAMPDRTCAGRHVKCEMCAG